MGNSEGNELPQKRGGRPMLIAVASRIWIIYGSFTLLCVVLILGGLFVDAIAGKVAGKASATAGFACFTGMVALFGAGFLLEGVSTLKGRAGDTRANGIGSIILGLISLSPFLIIHEHETAVAAVLGSALLLVAGALALLGRGEYLTWREARKGSNPA
jgi:hypothetical protein